MIDIFCDFVFVIGVFGFVGLVVVCIVQQKGYVVCVLVCLISLCMNVVDFDVEIVIGDMCDEVLMCVVLCGVCYLLYVVVDYWLWVFDFDEIECVNFEGVVVMMCVVCVVGVEWIVYISSVVMLKVMSVGDLFDENWLFMVEQVIGVYKCSKVFVECVVEWMIVDEGLLVVIVNLLMLIGLCDVKLMLIGCIIVEVVFGKIFVFVDMGLNFVYVDDVVYGYFFVFECGWIGECYIFGGENLLLQQMFVDIVQMMGCKVLMIVLLCWLLYLFVFGVEVVVKFMKKELFVIVDGLWMLKNKMYFMLVKVECEFGYCVCLYCEGLCDVLDWFGLVGYFK